MPKDRFIVEEGKRALGVAVRVQGGFQFFASDPAVRQLDGLVFPRVERLVTRAKEVLLMNGRAPPPDAE